MRFILASILMIFLTCKKQIASSDYNVASNSSVEMTKNSSPKVSETEKITIENNVAANEKVGSTDKKMETVANKQSSTEKPVSDVKEIIDFEEVNHYLFSLTPQNYLLINDQAKMDAVFSTIHKQSGGTRLAPIPTIMDDSSYLIVKPTLKTSNDVEIKQIYLRDQILYVDVKPVMNPDFKASSRISPNILVKLLKKVTNKKVTVKYL